MKGISDGYARCERVGADPSTDRAETQSELDYRIAFENLVTNISTKFVRLGLDEIDAGINDALRRIGEFAGVDRSYVILYVNDKTTISTTHEWCADGIPPAFDAVQDVRFSDWPWFTRRLALQLEAIYLPSIDKMPAEAKAERTAMKAQDIKSMVLVPIVYQNEALGFLGFDSVRSHKVWSKKSVVLLKIVGEIFVNALERKWAEEALQQAHRDLEHRVFERTAELQDAKASLENEIAERANVEVELMYHIELENIIMAVSTNFIGLAPDDVDQGINDSLRRIGEFAGVDRSYVLEFYNEGRFIDTTHEWCAEGIDSAAERVRTAPVDVLPWTFDQIKRCEVAYVPDAADLPEGALIDQREFEYQGIKSIIVVPTTYRGQVIGALGFDAVRSPKAWSDESIKLLKIVGEMFISLRERKRVEDALRESQRTLEQRVDERTREIERRREVAEGLQDILAVLNSNLPLTDVLDYLLGQAGKLLGSELGAVYKLDLTGTILMAESVLGFPADFVGSIVPVRRGIISQSVMLRGPLVGCDIPTYVPVKKSSIESKRNSMILELARRQRRVTLAIPVSTKDQVYGCIVLRYPDDRTFSAEELHLAATFGNHAALAIENAHLRERAEQHAAEAERSRLARELHDAVTQTLFSASLMAEMLPRVWNKDADQGLNCIEDIRSLTSGALAEMRALLVELRPAAIAESDLGELLRQLAEAVHNRARVPITVSIDGSCELPAEVRVSLYRIAQEALNNIVKHATAHKVRVSLEVCADVATLIVQDDGRGFDTASPRPGRFGLGIMQERAASVGARVTIASAAGKGTKVIVKWQRAEEN